MSAGARTRALARAPLSEDCCWRFREPQQQELHAGDDVAVDEEPLELLREVGARARARPSRSAAAQRRRRTPQTRAALNAAPLTAGTSLLRRHSAVRQSRATIASRLLLKQSCQSSIGLGLTRPMESALHFCLRDVVFSFWKARSPHGKSGRPQPEPMASRKNSFEVPHLRGRPLFGCGEWAIEKLKTAEGGGGKIGIQSSMRSRETRVEELFKDAVPITESRRKSRLNRTVRRFISTFSVKREDVIGPLDEKIERAGEHHSIALLLGNWV
jgi:hypothetical protein